MGIFLEKIFLAGLSAWNIFLILAPFLLLGLLIAGLFHILISRRHIEKMMSEPGLKGVVTAAALGAPLPICSCSVVPLSIALRRKGASLPVTQSFLITTPETSADSILVTWGLLGPLMAILRPVASFVTAILAGVFTIGLIREDDKTISGHDEKQGSSKDIHTHSSEHHHHHDHDYEDDPDYVGLRGTWLSLRWTSISLWQRTKSWVALSQWYKPDIYEERYDPKKSIPPRDESIVPLPQIFRRVFQFSFVELADDIFFPLVVGVLIGGIIMAVFPSNLADYGLGGGLLPYFIMLFVGIPIYMCASASTPIAAGLIIKGLSPGAGLVFLLAGPATNTATIIMLARNFGTRFLAIYLGSIATVAVGAGLLLDYLLFLLGLEIIPTLAPYTSSVAGIVLWVSAIALLTLIVWRFRKGAATAGFKDMFGDLASLIKPITRMDSPLRGWRSALAFTRSRTVKVAAPIFLAAYLATGFSVVPVGAKGYGRIFKKVVWVDLEPGLHYVPPWPFGSMDVKYVDRVRQLFIGISVGQPANAKPQTVYKTAVPSGSSWHTPASNKNAKTPQAEYLAGDEEFIMMVFSVHYFISNGYFYNYRIDSPEMMIKDYLQSVAREFVATTRMEPILNYERTRIERLILGHLQEHLDNPHSYILAHEHVEGMVHEGKEETGHVEGVVHEGKEEIIDAKEHFPAERGEGSIVTIVAVNLVDVHPPDEVSPAFRDVSSAKEDRETYQLRSLKYRTMALGKAWGNAFYEKETARADSRAEIAKAGGKTKSFIAQAKVVKGNRSILQDLLWFETSERALSDRQIFVLPSGMSAQDLVLWRERPKNIQRGPPQNAIIEEKGN